MAVVEDWAPQSAGAVWDRAGWPGSHGSTIPTNVAVTDALWEAVPAGVARAVVVAGGLALLADEELVQPATRPTRAASTAARGAWVLLITCSPVSGQARAGRGTADPAVCNREAESRLGADQRPRRRGARGEYREPVAGRSTARRGDDGSACGKSWARTGACATDT